MAVNARYISVILITLLLGFGCGTSCKVSEETLRGQWLQTADVLGGGGDADIVYEFSPPGLLRLIVGEGIPFPNAGYPSTIDDDFCQISWYYIDEGPSEPRYRWSNIELEDDQMIIDMVDPRLDSVVAENVVLTRVK
jgi:hypothetical protein